MAELKYSRLDNGKVIANHTGKYSSGLCFILDEEYDPFYNGYENISWESINLTRDSWAGFNQLRMIRGNFWTSKKGTKCFKPDFASGKHMLLEDGWSGSRSYTSDLLKIKNPLFGRCSTSNGGGAGHMYVIVPFGYVYEIPAEDFEPSDSEEEAKIPAYLEAHNEQGTLQIKITTEEALDAFVSRSLLFGYGFFLRKIKKSDYDKSENRVEIINFQHANGISDNMKAYLK